MASVDIHRNPRGHLGFGFGGHQRIGQNLTRVELQLRLAVPKKALRFQNEQEIYGVRELPVTW